MCEPEAVSRIKEVLKKFHAAVDDFGEESGHCPMREDEYCLAHNITTTCNVIDCPIEDIKIDWEGIENDANI